MPKWILGILLVWLGGVCDVEWNMMMHTYFGISKEIGEVIFAYTMANIIHDDDSF